MKRAVLPLLLLASLGGCSRERNTDVAAFIQQARDPQEQAILETIATYRTTRDEARACALASDEFIRRRFEGELDNCEQVVRTAPRHLPDTADVAAIQGDTARVAVEEPTSTRSVYVMRQDGGTWKIDDIVQPE